MKSKSKRKVGKFRTPLNPFEKLYSGSKAKKRASVVIKRSDGSGHFTLRIEPSTDAKIRQADKFVES